jgi:signal transduction histidine kinase
METQNVKGIVLTCNSNGIIQNINHNDVFSNTQNVIGKSFVALAEPTEIVRAIDFIHGVKTNLFSFGQYLTINVNKQKIRFYFIGLKIGEELLLIGSENHQEAIVLMEEMQKINNEQANLIRKLMKEKLSSQLNNEKNDERETSNLFNEITRINNELINLQRELTRKNTELERLNEIKNRFIGMAAHDLRNPLGVIQNYAEFLAEQVNDRLTENERWLLEVIRESSRFMLGLVENLLDYTKIESGKLELTKTRLNLHLYISKWVKVQSDFAKRKIIAVEYTTFSQEVIIEADAHKLEQVFNNLFSNAIKFSYPNSKIVVSLAKEGNFEILSVKDQGIGMSAEQMDKLFIPFARIVAEGTAGEKCTGLGLSIVKKIVEGHNGYIEVKSAPNQGSEFLVHLPIADSNSEKLI